MKPCRIQIDTGRLNRQWASAMPVTELTMPSTEKSWKIGRVSTTGGVMRKAMKLKNQTTQGVNPWPGISGQRTMASIT